MLEISVAQLAALEQESDLRFRADLLRVAIRDFKHIKRWPSDEVVRDQVDRLIDEAKVEHGFQAQMDRAAFVLASLAVGHAITLTLQFIAAANNVHMEPAEKVRAIISAMNIVREKQGP